jgi:hypothetical protein
MVATRSIRPDTQCLNVPSLRTPAERVGPGRSNGRHPKPPLLAAPSVSGRILEQLSSFLPPPCQLGSRARASVLPTPWNAAIAYHRLCAARAL